MTFKNNVIIAGVILLIIAIVLSYSYYALTPHSVTVTLSSAQGLPSRGVSAGGASALARP